MNYREYQPDPALRPYIKYYWSVTAENPGDLMRLKPYLAEGFEMLLNTGDPFTVTTGSSCFRSDQNFCLTGPMTRPMKVRPSGSLDLLGICFRAGGGYSFFTRPAGEFVNWFGNPDDLLGAELRCSLEQLRNIRIKEDCIKAAESLLMRIIGENSRRDDIRFLNALRSIHSRNGSIAVGRLSELTGMSSRQLERLFKERVGIMPKQLCRNLRFKNLFNQLKRIPSAPMASVALACGYYDQSHMINEFKHYTGMSPAAYFGCFGEKAV